MPVYRPSTPSIDGVVTVKGTPNFDIPGSTSGNAQTVVSTKFDVSGTGVVVAYTVTTDKTFYLYSITLSDTAARLCELYLDDGTTIVAEIRIGGSGQATLSPATPIAVYTTAQEVKVLTGNTGSNITLVGIEVTD